MNCLCSARNTCCKLVGTLAIIGATGITAKTARAIPHVFSILTNQSSIAVSGTVDLSGSSAPIQPQGTGSLNAHYAGTIKTDLFAGGISFLPGSIIDANSTGSWKPLADGSDGAATADYGGKVTYFLVLTTNFAGRNFVAGLNSDFVPVNGGGNFDLSTTTVSFASGDLAYRGPGGSPAGATSFAGQSGALSGTASLTSQVQGSQTTDTMTVPVNAAFVLALDATTTVNLTMTGQIVASSTFTTPLWGDYNQNGAVDAADYAAWREKLGTGASLPNDDTPGVALDDFARWRANFGQTMAGTGAAFDDQAASPVPEASSLALAALASIIFGACRHRRGKNRKPRKTRKGPSALLCQMIR